MTLMSVFNTNAT